MWLALRRLSGNGPYLSWRGEPPGFSRVAAGALDLRRGPQGPALVASGKASPHASCSGASRDSSPIDTGPKTLCGVGAGTWGFLSSADMDLELELDMEQQTGSKLGKEYVKAVYCHPTYLTKMQSTSWEMLCWMKKHKLDSKLQGEISITSDMQMIPPLWQKVKKN